MENNTPALLPNGSVIRLKEGTKTRHLWKEANVNDRTSAAV